MITPSFALTATERVLPRLALDFTTASLDSRVTFTRSGNTATVTNSSGNIVNINANLPRFDYDPTTLVCKGLLIEEARTNVLVNSLINGTNLTTQIVTTTAVAYTLSFYGTGNIVLSGTSSSTQTGSGAYPSRKTYTFTPTAGALTLTVSGTVQYAQLEVGSFATSFIPTDGTSKTRNTDFASMTGTNFSSWYNQTEGTFVSQSTYNGTTAVFQRYGVAVSDGTGSNRIATVIASGSQTRCLINAGGVLQADIYNTVTSTFNTPIKTALAYKANDVAISCNAGTVQTDNTVTIPTVNAAYIGGAENGTAGVQLNGTVAKIYYYPQRLTNAELQAFSK